MRKLILIGLCCLFLLVPIAAAQQPTPIGLEQNQLGEVSSTTPQPSFTFDASNGQTVEIEILSVTDGFAPQMTVYTAQGVLLQAIGNPTQANTISAVVSFPSAGSYEIQVNSANNTTGQFVITVRSTQPAIPLPEDNPQVSQLAPGALLIYRIDPRSDLVRSLIIGAGNSETVPDRVRAELSSSTGELLALFSSLLGGGTIILPPSTEPLTLVLVNDQPDDVTIEFSVLLSTLDVTAAPEEEAFVLPPLPTNQGCILATNLNSGVNVRSGPSLAYDPPFTVISQLNFYPVLARSEDSGWYVIDYGDGEGWVGSSVTRLAGDCSALPVRQAPPLPTQAPTGTLTAQPTLEATEEPGAFPTPEVTVDVLPTEATPEGTTEP